MRSGIGRAAGLLVALWAGSAAADGLRISTNFAGYNYPGQNGGPDVGVYAANVGARVSRGRAGMSVGLPFIGISGGRVVSIGGDDRPAVVGGDEPLHWGRGDVSMGLDYNVIQNRQTKNIYVVTLSGQMRFRTGAVGLGGEEDLVGAGLSGVYGLTRQLLLFADVRQTWAAFNRVSPQRRAGNAEIGGVYWATESLGVTAGLNFYDYLTKGNGESRSLELNAGLLFELFPGFSLNATGIGGLAGQGPRGGGAFGFGIDL